MKFFRERLERANWLAGLLSLSFLAIQALPTATAQNAITIPNTGTANFRDEVNPEVRNATSNQTSVSAIVVPATLEVIKSADRQAAEPGDPVIYRLLIRNTGQSSVTNLAVTDTLPLGARFVSKSLKGSLTDNNRVRTEVRLPEATVADRTVTITYPGEFAAKQTLEVVYAVTLTPDALRGNGRNIATATATSGGRQVASNTASNRVQIRSGILTDCGTLVGRVFVDRNFDGEQQPGEPGVPNAVIYLDDGNRITTDANGLFSVSNVISGYRSGTLDLTSIPGYALAPNLYNIEKNSQSRLVRLSPGGMARMNFAVTPSSGEAQTLETFPTSR